VTGWREGYVVGGETRFFVRAFGHGEDLALLLHGWPETGDCWRRVAPMLVDAGYRVACPDLKGFGRSTSTGRYDSRTLADEISRLIRALHVRKAVLVGHDWGGAVALATAFRHPGRVRALVLTNSPARNLDLRRAWHIPLFNLPILPELAFRIDAQRLIRTAFRYAAEVQEAFPEEIIRRYTTELTAPGNAWLAYYRTLSRRAAFDAAGSAVRRRLPLGGGPRTRPRLRVPTTVLWGEHDPVLTVATGRDTASDLDAPFIPLSGVGHFPHEEDPLQFTRALLDAVGAPGTVGPRTPVAVPG
jgi:pimeloyl-ACP methyl ester carboxylesterase